MSRIAQFRKQHEDILQLVRSIHACLKPALSQDEANRIRELLAQLNGKLSLHLAMEDKALYPNLQGHPDAKVRALSQRFSQEMGSLAAGFGDYVRKWPTSRAILGSPIAFVSESRALFLALERRIAREDQELYPMAERSIA